MSKLLIAVAFTAALSTSALAVPTHVQSRSEPPHWQRQARNGQITMNKLVLALAMLTAL
jgi:hypothetical protein